MKSTIPGSRRVGQGTDWLHEILVAKGIFERRRKYLIQPLPANPLRSDRRKRKSFIVWQGSHAVLHVSLASDLKPVWQAHRMFARQAPELVCKPEFLFRADGTDIVGREYFSGHDLEQAMRRGVLAPDDAVEILAEVMDQFEFIAQKSGIAAELAELDSFESSILDMEAWSDFDRVFLREIALPGLRNAIGDGPFNRRWSNGDFIAKNIIVDSRKRFRVVDYEFAKNTHFFRDDYLRFVAFSPVPEPVKQHVAARHGDDLPGEQLYFLLNHALLIERILPADLARTDIAKLAERISALLTPSMGRRSDFFSKRFRSNDGAKEEAAASRPEASVYWSPRAEFFEEARVRHAYDFDRDQVLEFEVPAFSRVRHLRFDPADRIGICHVKQVVVRSLVDQSVLVELGTAREFDRIKVAGSALRLPSEEGLALLCTGNDPQILLPDLGEPANDPLRIEAHLRHDSNLFWLQAQVQARLPEDGFGQPWELPERTPPPALIEAQAELERLSRDRDAAAASVDRLRAELSEARTGSERLRSTLTDLESTRSQLEQHVAERRQDLDALNARFAEANEVNKSLVDSKVGEINRLHAERARDAEHFNQELTALRQAMEATQSALREHDARNRELTTRVTDQEKVIAELGSARDQLTISLRGTIEDKDNEINRIHAEKNSLLEQRDAVERDLRAQLSAQATDFETTRTELTKLNEERALAIDAVNARVNELDARAADLASRLAEAESAAARSTAEFAQSRENLAAQARTLRDRVANQAVTIEQQQTTQTALKSQVTRLEQLGDGQAARLANLQDEVTAAARYRADLESRFSSCQEELAKTRAARDRLQGELDDARQVQTNTESRILLLRSRLTEAEHTRADLESQLAAAAEMHAERQAVNQRRLATSAEALEAAQKEVDGLRGELQRQTSELQQLQAQLAATHQLHESRAQEAGMRLREAAAAATEREKLFARSIAQKERELQVAQEEIRRVREQNQEIATREQALTEAIAASGEHERSALTLRRALEAADGVRMDLESRLDLEKQRAQNFHRDFLAEQEKSREWIESLHALNAEVENLRDAMRIQQEDLERAQQELPKQRDALARAHMELHSRTQQLQDLNTRHSQLQGEHSTAEAEREQLAARLQDSALRIDQLQLALAAAREEIAARDAQKLTNRVRRLLGRSPDEP